MNSTLLSFPAPDLEPIRCHRPATRESFDDLAYWNAANYLTLGQLYLRANPLLREPLAPEHLKRGPAGAWRHCALTNLLYTQLNRLVCSEEARASLVVAPSGATPAVLANLWLDGTYSERVGAVPQDAEGMAALFRRYGGPKSVPPELGAHVHNGAIAEPELGEGRLALLAATGAALGATDLVALCLLSEQQALHALSSPEAPPTVALQPGRDGLVVPVVELGAAGEGDDVLEALRQGGFAPFVVEEQEPCMAHAAVADALARARATAPDAFRPALVVVTPPAFALPIAADGAAAHPSNGSEDAAGDWLYLPHAAHDARQRTELADWLLAYGPEALFDAAGAPAERIAALVPPVGRRVGERVGVRRD